VRERVALGKERRQHSLAAHSQWIESITKKMHKARPARLNDILQGGSWETTKSVRKEIGMQRGKTLKRNGDELRSCLDEAERIVRAEKL
jgi:hypothetical protein